MIDPKASEATRSLEQEIMMLTVVACTRPDKITDAIAAALEAYAAKAVAEEREQCAEWLRERARSVLAEAKKLPFGAVHDGGNLHGASRYNVQGEIYKELQWAGNVLVRERSGAK